MCVSLLKLGRLDALGSLPGSDRNRFTELLELCILVHASHGQVVLGKPHPFCSGRPPDKEVLSVEIVSDRETEKDAELKVRVETEKFVSFPGNPEDDMSRRQETIRLPLVDIRAFGKVTGEFLSTGLRAEDPALEASLTKQSHRFAPPVAFQDLVPRSRTSQEH